ncbi:MBL fold metallo-hydrolase [Rhodococcus xishaensis]|uniref:MBL fold metallo-hydrolase n=1 Tax=Rhodococcus xishaensis TaxID=2487364 RepID=A0A3S3ADZ0_9NOCA|nr:MBL fold metallo-hydrolase [Rhodococcus xishaensis]RVW05757.1 MBL fold metallo-hydrolase [Rhodococcus xishaensis]
MEQQRITIDDDYTGDLSDSDAAQRRTVPGATIIKMSVGPMDNNTYLITCSETGRSVLVDAANDATRILQLVEEQAPQLELIITTHQHHDHWFALAEVAEKTGVPTAAHPLDSAILSVPPTRSLEGGDTVTVGNLLLEVIHLSGHTPGGITLALKEQDENGRVHLFTGDSLFPGGVGKTPDAEHFTSLMNDVEGKLFARFPDDTAFYPGHGKDSTLGAERPHLAEWRERGW